MSTDRAELKLILSILVIDDFFIIYIRLRPDVMGVISI